MCKKKLQSFTLLELIVVVTIIGILASIALPQFSKSVEKSRQAEAINVLVKAYQGYKALQIDEKTIDSNDWADPNIIWPKLGFDQDPNTNSKYFEYKPAILIFAFRKGYLDVNDQRWIAIYLDTGEITKGDYYK